MAETAEPQTEVADAVVTEEKTTTATEESTAATETPESDAGGASAEKAEAEGESEAAKPEEGKAPETAPEKESGDGDSDKPNGVAKGDEGEKSKEEESKEAKPEEKKEGETTESKAAPVVSSSKKSRPPYKYDPNKITLRFLFANRDGLTVTVECAPSDTVGEVKGALLSVWPEGKILILLVSCSRCTILPISPTLVSAPLLRSAKLFWRRSHKTNMHGKRNTDARY